jgi:hypothetical protein
MDGGMGMELVVVVVVVVQVEEEWVEEEGQAWTSKGGRRKAHLHLLCRRERYGQVAGLARLEVPSTSAARTGHIGEGAA